MVHSGGLLFVATLKFAPHCIVGSRNAAARSAALTLPEGIAIRMDYYFLIERSNR